MLATDTDKLLEQVLKERQLISSATLDALRMQSAQDGKSILSLIVEQNLIEQEDLVKIQAEVNKLPYANLTQIVVPPDVVNLIPKDTAKSYMAVPFGRLHGRLAVGMLDPTNIQAVDFITRKINQPLTVYMVSEKSVDRILGQYRADVSQEVSDVVSSLQQIVPEKKADNKPITTVNLQNLVQDAPITRALNTILEYAAQQNASDIHIEPREKELKIRYRIDGILHDTMTLPKAVEPALISRIKILSNLKIDEHRIPQDGQFQIASSGREIDLRIAISPVVWGEQVVIRLLDKDGALLTLDALGFRGVAFKRVKEGLHRPHGMTLSTGPTGSGKSTTMYAAIQEIKNVAINIVTLEDPVEYKMDGINQIQVNSEVGLTFASGLRSILRQDPNVVMVGEIRDKETADLAVQAALTGHVVLSTIHTNSASGVLPRLLDMGIEPFLIASTVNTVIGQRLVRRLCPKCKKAEQSNQVETDSIKQVLADILPKSAADAKTATEHAGYENLPLVNQSAYTLYRAVGCSACTNGYSGRTGIYEVFVMSNEMEHMLAAHATTNDIQAQAQKEGMINMKQDGYLKVLTGVSTLEEVARVAADF
jgi:type IV pilus assembly protein PilB